jgi:hypothetical protein
VRFLLMSPGVDMPQTAARTEPAVPAIAEKSGNVLWIIAGVVVMGVIVLGVLRYLGKL